MVNIDSDMSFMRMAMDKAALAYRNVEVPVGAVVVYESRIIAEGFNSVIGLSDPTAHAEIIALKKAGEKIGNYRLLDAELFVTLEPCLMCYSAMVHARIKRVIYGAADKKTGYYSTGSFDLISSIYNHKIERVSGILETESSDLLKKFFKERRDAGAAERGGLENR